MRRPILIAAAAGTLALGGTAIAFPGHGPLGPLLGGDPDERRAELARDLASKLDGVSPQEVERALREIAEERRAEHRRRLARGLASNLDGVSAEQAEDALKQAEQQRRTRLDRAQPPEPGAFTEVLARELDKSEAQIREALRAVHRSELEQKLDEAVKDGRISEQRAGRIRERLEDGPPGGWLRRAPLPAPPGGPPGAFEGEPGPPIPVP